MNCLSLNKRWPQIAAFKPVLENCVRIWHPICNGSDFVSEE
jgi:hypothetical protein